jgi:hypothetical protein
LLNGARTPQRLLSWHVAADQTAGLLSLEKGILPLGVLRLPKESRLFYLEERVPRYLLLYLYKEIIAALFARSKLYWVNLNELS